jgi:hypothetical protein
MGLEIWSLIISIMSSIIAIAAIIQAIVWRQIIKRETEESLSILTHVIVNSAGDPDTVRKMLEDYNKSGKWRAKVSRRFDGRYILEFSFQDSSVVEITGNDKIEEKPPT